MKKECVWCKRLFKPTMDNQKFCSMSCLNSVYRFRDELMKHDNNVTLNDAIKKHKETDTIIGRKPKEIKFVHYSSSGGRWE